MRQIRIPAKCCKQAEKMKKVLTIIMIFLSLNCFAQNELLTLKENGDSLDNLIPKGWKIVDSKLGDLNKDGIPDLVFVIQNTDKKNIELNEGFGNNTTDSNPRVLGIYFGTKTGAFEKKLVSKDFIVGRDSPAMDEPFEGVQISKKGVLEINFRFWYSAGSWGMSKHKYKFRYSSNEFVLIGYESSEAHRSSGVTTDYSINFLTKKMKITKGNYSTNSPKTVEWKKFKLENPLTIESIGKPFELEFNGIYL